MIKCIVWDLDNTLWSGTLAENNNVKLRHEVLETIKYLDKRGVIHSIASRNEHDIAIGKLNELEIGEYFLCPQICWGFKSESIRKIQETLNIGIDTIAFIDDDPFERSEVLNEHPAIGGVMMFTEFDEIIESLDIKNIPVTKESRKRRFLYRDEFKRKDYEEKFSGEKEIFLKSLDLEFEVRLANKDDLKRISELTERTSQLNSTGNTFSEKQLNDLICSDNYTLLVASLRDYFGDYGMIGLSLIETDKKRWNILLLIVSCRVLSRGIGQVFLNYIVQKSKAENVALYARFRPTSRNRIMYITYKFSGFKEFSQDEEDKVLVYSGKEENLIPDYIDLRDSV